MILLLQPIPSIPTGIKGEGLIAVLFLIILGWVAAIYAINKVPKAISPLVASIDRLVASNVDLAGRLTKLEVSMEVLERQVESVRCHAAGLTIAYLNRVGYDDYADEIRRDNPDAVTPPQTKRRQP